MKKGLLTYTAFVKVILVIGCLASIPTIHAKKSSITSTIYDIEGIEVGMQGTYLVKVHIYTSKSSASTEEIKYAAVHGVIFRGFTGKGFSVQKPMAQPETEFQHADFYSSFFNNGDYLSYANVINATADRVKTSKKEYKITAIVSVAKDSLRKTLESAGMIRNLNSVF